MELQHGGNTYVVGRIPAMTQGDIVAQLAPVCGALLPYMGKKDGTPAEAGQAMLKAFAGVPKAERHQLIYDLLGCVQRRVEGGSGWAKVVNSAGTGLMYDDLDLVGIGLLCWNALQVNLASFIDALPPEFREAIQKQLKPSAG